MNRVSKLLIPYNPRFATADYSPVRRWLEEGADMEQDILPVLREWTARKPDIYSLGFFTRYVLMARDARNKPQPCIHHRAKAIAFAVRRVGRRMPQEERWLEEYERRYGMIGEKVFDTL